MGTESDEELPTPTPIGVSRRAFMTSCGAGTLLVAARSGTASEQRGEPNRIPAETRTPITLRVNGRSHQVFVEPRWSLLSVLRDELGLTAAKPGCERGECGACSVLIDDRPRYACLTLALEAQGLRIETAEGLMDGEAMGVVQTSFVDEDGLQCGYCTPGQVIAAEGLLRHNSNPSFDEIRQGMSGNLCRCGAYAHIFNAVATAAQRRKA